MARPRSGWTDVWRRRLQVTFVAVLIVCAVAVWYLVVTTSRWAGAA